MIKMFDKKGNIINDGYTPHYDYLYEREKVKCSEFKSKEWDMQDFRSGDYIFQYIVAHALVVDNYYVGLINTKTNERHYVNIMKLHHKGSIKMISNPEHDYEIIYREKNLNLDIKLEGLKHIVKFSGIDQNGDEFSACAKFESVIDGNRMCILHKFSESSKMFFLNYKENYFDCDLEIKSKTINIHDTKATGLIDHGRGYWPFKSKWYWGNASFYLNDKRVGWNLGYGFGISKDKENIVYYDNKSYKLGNITMTIDEKNPFKGYEVNEEEGKLHLEYYDSFFDNYSETKFLFIYKWCHQVFHKTRGYIIIDNNKIEFNDIISFMEYEENRW